MLNSLMMESTPLDSSKDDLVRWMLRGHVLIRTSDSEVPVALTPVELHLSRTIEPPQSEHPLQMAFDSYTEDLYTNVTNQQQLR